MLSADGLWGDWWIESGQDSFGRIEANSLSAKTLFWEMSSASTGENKELIHCR